MAGSRSRRQRHFLVERRPRLTRTWYFESRFSKRREAEASAARKKTLLWLFAEFRVRQQDTKLQ